MTGHKQKPKARLAIEINRDLRQAFKVKAVTEGKNIASKIRELISDYLEQE
jgi:hypothetical protein